MKYNAKEIFDIERVQKLMDKFLEATGTATGLLDIDGNVLTASGWQPICTQFHRVHPETMKNCLESDTALANGLSEGKKYNIYRCLNGLIDVAMPITVRGVHIANLFIGQFLDKKPNIEFFRVQARKYGFNESEYLEALGKVQILTEDEVKKKLAFLSELADLIGEFGWQRQKSFEIQDELEERVNMRTQALRDSQVATLNIMQDVEEGRLKTEKLLENLKVINKELEMFAYVASHDLQEPLRKVSNYTELLEKRYSELFDERAQKYMNYIVDGSMRMQQLINDLLKFSRVKTRGKEFHTFDMNQEIKYVIENLEYEIERKEAKIEYAELPEIKGDSSQIRQVFQNLLSNALKFNGNIRPDIKISVKEDINYWQFTISDNGIGIEEKYKEKIFVIFQRLHSHDEYKGTGIGLALCKKIVERHGGKIWFDSELGKGTRFHFTVKKNL